MTEPILPPDLSPTLSILMPAYNEATTIREAVGRVLSTALPSYELIIVDDGSTDGTREILRTVSWPSQVRVYYHDGNHGKGAAVRTALTHAQGRFAGILDADLEYSPSDLPTLLAPLLGGESLACFGVRGFRGHTSHSYLFVLGNRFVTLVANVLFNVYLQDVMTCHKILDTGLFRSLPLRERGFGIEPELAARVIQRGVRIYEVPVHYRARTFEEGKKLTWVDGLRAVRTLARCRATPNALVRGAS